MSEDMIFLHVDTPGGKGACMVLCLDTLFTCSVESGRYIYVYASFRPLVAMIVNLYNVTKHLQFHSYR